MNIPEQEILRRRDMRDVLTFTIDPASAKDYDDALSFRILDNGVMQIGVHIADVSYYVRPGSDIDINAYNAATSIYLVDRVIPMLPEELSNDLCSLRANEDKLCMSVVFDIDEDAKVLKYKICRTVICSDYRLSYEQAEQLLHSDAASESSPQHDLLSTLNRLNQLAKRLRQQRFAAGAMQIDQAETLFDLDEDGMPINIYFKQLGDANHLIEEFMLLANRTIATHLKDRLTVYRVHDKPDEEKIAQLNTFIKRMGDRVQPHVIDMLTIRATPCALYTTNNIGHYGLAFPYYTHFTSPIRRYPDLMIHRIVARYILGERHNTAVCPLTSNDKSIDKELLEQACKHCSEQEQFAQQLERDSIKEYQTLWLQNHKDEVFDAHISGVTEYGLFVQLDQTHCEGLIHIGHIEKSGYMYLDEPNYRIVAQRTGNTYNLGDPIRVRVNRVDTERCLVDFLPCTDE